MLYLVATPIGNLGDITYRAVETLKRVCYILCEDTRHTHQLLHHYDITAQTRSFHRFNEVEREDAVIADLQQGLEIALVSDAGTPGIADPGSRLVERCVAAALPVTAIPGACAAVVALTSSGLDTNRFQFFGFLPRQTGQLRTTFAELLAYRGTTICYESPHRLVETLQLLDELAPQRKLVVARELTKKFEQSCSGTAAQLLALWAERQVKGEIVLLISAALKEETSVDNWSDLSPRDHIAQLELCYSLTRREAIKLAANLRGISSRTLYNALIDK